MTVLKYLALGVASTGLAYSLFMANYTVPPLPCTELLLIKEKAEREVAAAEPQRTWYGSPFGSVITDTEDNIRRHETLESTLAELNGEYIRRCESPGPL